MKKRYIVCLLFSIIFLLSLSTFVSAEFQTLINSDEWIDVYSGMLYSRLNYADSDFVIDELHGIEQLGILDRNIDDVILIESDDPYVIGYNNMIKNKGFDVEVISNKDPLDTNFELAQRTSLTSFIIIDNAYAYNAISVAPYAVATDSYVLFANKRNIDDVKSFLESRDSAVMLYGRLDREVKDALSVFNPEIIYNRDKYRDNLELAQRHCDISHRKQILFSNGDFIEKSYFYGEDPILFIGKSNIPDGIVDFIKERDIEIGVLVGTDIIENAKFIKDATDIKLFVKYAQGRNSVQKALDMFFLPQYYIDIQINSINYNKATKQLEVTYFNKEPSKGFFKASHEIIADDASIVKIGDENVVFIDSKEIKTITYELDMTDYLNDDIKISSLVLFGPEEQNLDRMKTFISTIAIIEYLDESQIDILDLEYNKNLKRFYVELKNLGDKTAYVDLDLIDILIDQEPISFSLENIASIDPGKKGIAKIRADLSDADIEDNPYINVRARYGSRPEVLVKNIEKQMPMKVTVMNYTLLIILLLVFVAVISYMLGKKDTSKKKKRRK